MLPSWTQADPFDAVVLTGAAVFLVFILVDAVRVWWKARRVSIDRHPDDYCADGEMPRW